MTINQMLALKPGDKVLVDGKIEVFERRSLQKWRNDWTGKTEWAAFTDNGDGSRRHAYQMERLDE